MEQPGRAGARVAQGGLVLQDDDRPARAPEHDLVPLGREHLEGDDVAVERGHAVEVADEERDGAHRGGGVEAVGVHDLFHM